MSASGVTFTTASKWDDGNYHIDFYNSSKKFSFIISTSGTVLSSDTTPNTTTTKATTAVKNVTAAEVQAQVNSYIKSKGVTLDSSLNSGNSGWNGRISTTQDYLNNGGALKSCKFDVDELCGAGAQAMYCYYDGNYLYVCYML